MTTHGKGVNGPHTLSNPTSLSANPDSDGTRRSVGNDWPNGNPMPLSDTGHSDGMQKESDTRRPFNSVSIPDLRWVESTRPHEARFEGFIPSSGVR